MILGDEALDDLLDSVMLLDHGHVEYSALIWIFSLQKDGEAAVEGPFVTGQPGEEPLLVKVVDKSTVFEDVILGPPLASLLG